MPGPAPTRTSRSPSFASAVVLAVIAAGWPAVVVPDAFGMTVTGRYPGSADVESATPAQTLVMPFDATGDRVSRHIVSRVDEPASAVPLATHWSYWSHDCRHLVDVIVCLTPNDTKVMPLTHVQGEAQTASPQANVGQGSVTDLSGERGVLLVTAYVADLGSSHACDILDRETFAEPALVGAWTIVDSSTKVSYGSNAIGMRADVLAVTAPAELLIQTLDPTALAASEVIVIGVETRQGNGSLDAEIGPIQRSRVDGHHVCCEATYTDDLEVTTSLPDVCWQCVGFNPISQGQATGSDPPLIPPSTVLASPGVLRLSSCEVSDENGVRVPLGAAADQLLVAFHGQALMAAPPRHRSQLDHYKCWQVHDLKSPKFVRRPDTRLDDQFRAERVDVMKPVMICNPADNEGSGIVDPSTHLCCYKTATKRRLDPKRRVEVAGQFGTFEWEAKGKPKLLCEPCDTVELP